MYLWKRKHFKQFLDRDLILWPGSATDLPQKFLICEQYARGEPLWCWVEFIGDLKMMKIVWDPAFDDPETLTFIISVDTFDLLIREMTFGGYS
mmetsp:Transcript_12633/g.18145  ORF Transcript_12633/g.18145 Transcript_12633/m.18145 type:complete len:93 (+) Transcript_12633:289-567(+)|eukprot:CAMPEP_0202466800 /NCGR_PEP_ID=MMETSP1360-20130828/69946_1 /ASSEMBLY_ACC=CAM_ASM_000848 /TAXON_ID=515479 /ORGANISM="Licmophora paradoxa, Strain CCMP2313" /LENGTH=92 /DNA_ID=CAMNT_0049091073 /DNA_START=292 /DNA_END=570 /DNA_ORIENTATION=-